MYTHTEYLSNNNNAIITITPSSTPPVMPYDEIGTRDPN